MTTQGIALKIARIEEGLTIREVSKKTGLSKDTISKLERGVHAPQPLTLAKLAKAYGRPVEDFVKEDEDLKADAPLSLEWAVAAPLNERLQTLQNSHVEVLKDLYQETVEGIWEGHKQTGRIDHDLDALAAEIRKELGRRDPPAYVIRESPDTIEVRWLVPAEERAPYRELLSERLQEIIEGDEQWK